MKTCLNCVERQLNCHSSCENYAELKKRKEEENRRYRELNNAIEWNGYMKAMKKRRD